MDNKMTAEQALEWIDVYGFALDTQQVRDCIEVLRAALSAPRVPESIDRLREASAKGFSTSKSCGPDGKYQSVTEFRSLSDLQDYERARIALLAASPEPVAPTDNRPENCRERLREEGKAYPRSGCVGCGSSLSNGGLRPCPYAKGNSDPASPDQQVIADLRAEVEALKLELHNVHVDRALAESEVEALRTQQVTGMANARRMIRGIKTKPNWWLFAQLFGTGKTTAMQRCESLGIDPDAPRLREGGA